VKQPNKHYLPIVVVIIALLALPSCSSQKEPPAPEAKEHGVVSEAFEDYCTDCHQGSRALGVVKNVDEWKAVTRKMSQFRESRTGEGIPQDAQDEIIDYLMKGSY
jgi:hypothetical protein